MAEANKHTVTTVQYYYNYTALNCITLSCMYTTTGHVHCTAVNTKTREHGSQSSRKLKMAPVRLKDRSHFGSRTIFGEQNSIHITINDVKRRFRNTNSPITRLTLSGPGYLMSLKVRGGGAHMPPPPSNLEKY